METIPEVNRKTNRRAMIVAGEASGDLHGANLILAASISDPGLTFFGVGGPLMQEAGCHIVMPLEKLAVMGLSEVIGHLPSLYRAFRKLKALLHNDTRPDVLILVDFQEFNLLLARAAKRIGIPVLFYVSPTVWAWRRGRVKKMARAVDRLAVIFPFEPSYYEGEDIEVEYVGHPLLDEVQGRRCKADFVREFSLDGNSPIIGLFPGSRKSELKYNLPTILESAATIRGKLPSAQFVLPVAASFNLDEIYRYLGDNSLSIRLMQENVYDIANSCDAIITVSGTVTLQIALVGTPMAIVYKMAPLTYFVGRRVIKMPYIGLVNIVAGKKVVQEFVQQDATANNVAREIFNILEHTEYNRAMREELGHVRSHMGEAGCSARVARMASEMSHGFKKKEQLF